MCHLAIRLLRVTGNYIICRSRSHYNQRLCYVRVTSVLTKMPLALHVTLYEYLNIAEYGLGWLAWLDVRNGGKGD